MPAPKATKHPTDTPPGIEVVRTFEPDHERQVAALVRLLETARMTQPGVKDHDHGERNT